MRIGRRVGRVSPRRRRRPRHRRVAMGTSMRGRIVLTAAWTWGRARQPRWGVRSVAIVREGVAAMALAQPAVPLITHPGAREVEAEKEMEAP
ncbi:MAG: hypothetical protein HYS86_01995 [Candidatus Chisholmbacteria bacterium]|nr:hypothetical protein [Candidatus Chisholmbacteria bacterium]